MDDLGCKMDDLRIDEVFHSTGPSYIQHRTSTFIEKAAGLWLTDELKQLIKQD